jgi:hypothetical protein
LAFNSALTRLIAREDFSIFIRRECLKYLIFYIHFYNAEYGTFTEMMMTTMIIIVVIVIRIILLTAECRVFLEVFSLTNLIRKSTNEISSNANMCYNHFFNINRLVNLANR